MGPKSDRMRLAPKDRGTVAIAISFFLMGGASETCRPQNQNSSDFPFSAVGLDRSQASRDPRHQRSRLPALRLPRRNTALTALISFLIAAAVSVLMKARCLVILRSLPFSVSASFSCSSAARSALKLDTPFGRPRGLPLLPFLNWLCVNKRPRLALTHV